MKPVARHMLPIITGLASTYTLFRHILPVDTKYHNGIMLLLAIGSIWLLHRLYSRGVSAVQRLRQCSAVERCAYLLIGVVMTSGLVWWLGSQYPLRKIDIQITATGQQNIAAKGKEVWLKALYVDGKYLDMTSYRVDYHGWEMLNNAWVAVGNQPTTLAWQGLAGKDLQLVFGRHPYSGQVNIAVLGKNYDLDLYGAEETIQEVTIPVANPSYNTAQGKVITYLADFITAGLLLLVLLAIMDGIDKGWKNTNRQGQRAYQGWLLRGAGVLACGTIAILLLNYMVDPLQFYRRAAYVPHWSKEQRYQNPGIAKNYAYDTVLLGTSTIENYIPGQVDEWLGSKSVKLAISGSTLHEQNLTLQMALRTGQVKRVIWGLDLMAFGGTANQVETGAGAFPMYLYQPNVVNGLQYLFNNTTTQQSMEILAQRLGLVAYPAPQLALLNAWQHQVVFGHESVQRNFRQIQKADFGDNQTLRRLYNANNYIVMNLKNNIDVNLIPVIAAQPGVQFDVFFPPSHILFLTVFYQQNPQAVVDWLAARQYLVQNLAAYPNVTIHDFQEDESYILTDEYYKDVLHYDKRTGDSLLQKIKNKTQQVNQEIIERHNGYLLNLIRYYNSGE